MGRKEHKIPWRRDVDVERGIFRPVVDNKPLSLTGVGVIVYIYIVAARSGIARSARL